MELEFQELCDIFFLDPKPLGKNTSEFISRQVSEAGIPVQVPLDYKIPKSMLSGMFEDCNKSWFDKDSQLFSKWKRMSREMKEFPDVYMDTQFFSSKQEQKKCIKQQLRKEFPKIWEENFDQCMKLFEKGKDFNFFTKLEHFLAIQNEPHQEHFLHEYFTGFTSCGIQLGIKITTEEL